MENNEDDLIIEFTPELMEDIEQSEIEECSVNFVNCYYEELHSLDELNALLSYYLELEYYYMAESLKRALNAVKIIFK